MPIDRDDGRHFCNPAEEMPDADQTWTCPCGNVWAYDGLAVWTPAGSLPAESPAEPEETD